MSRVNRVMRSVTEQVLLHHAALVKALQVEISARYLLSVCMLLVWLYVWSLHPVAALAAAILLLLNYVGQPGSYGKDHGNNGKQDGTDIMAVNHKPAKLFADKPIERSSSWLVSAGMDTVVSVQDNSRTIRVPKSSLQVAGGPSGVMAVQDMAAGLIKDHSLCDTFYIYHLDTLRKLYDAWTSCMPRVLPFYAMKCNPEPIMVNFLAAIGAGFDCASKDEIILALQAGVTQDRIIFANPCKKPEDVAFALSQGVTVVTFDTVQELVKLQKFADRLECVLRIRYDDPSAAFKLGMKYGARPEHCKEILQAAKLLGMNVMGVSFHIGSAGTNFDTYDGAIKAAKDVFIAAEELGFNMKLLDIGGGFSGRFGADGKVIHLEEVAAVVNNAIATHFDSATYSELKIISEPGRYFAEASATVCAMVIGSRIAPVDTADAIFVDDAAITTASAIAEQAAPADTQQMSHKTEYWITDGVYGSFMDTLLLKTCPDMIPLRSPLLPAVERAADTEVQPSAVWGPTCCCLDQVAADVKLPEMRVGDWLVFPNTGAYTASITTNFNGMGVGGAQRFVIME